MGTLNPLTGSPMGSIELRAFPTIYRTHTMPGRAPRYSQHPRNLL